MVFIKVLEAQGLKSSFSTGLIGSYCVLGEADLKGEFVHERTSCARSEVSRENLNPAWEKAVLYLKSPVKVRIEVWEEDKGKSDTFLGLVVLDKTESCNEWISLQSRELDKPVSGQIRVTIYDHDTPPYSLPQLSIPSTPSTSSLSPSTPSTTPSTSFIPPLHSYNSSPTIYVASPIPTSSAPSTPIPQAIRSTSLQIPPLSLSSFSTDPLNSANPRNTSPRKNITLTNPSARSIVPFTPTSDTPTAQTPSAVTLTMAPLTFSALPASTSNSDSTIISPRKKVSFTDSPSSSLTAPRNPLRSSGMYPKASPTSPSSLRKSGNWTVPDSTTSPPLSFPVPTTPLTTSLTFTTPLIHPALTSLDSADSHITSPRKKVELLNSLLQNSSLDSAAQIFSPKTNTIKIMFSPPTSLDTATTQIVSPRKNIYPPPSEAHNSLRPSLDRDSSQIASPRNVTLANPSSPSQVTVNNSLHSSSGIKPRGTSRRITPLVKSRSFTYSSSSFISSPISLRTHSSKRDPRQISRSLSPSRFSKKDSPSKNLSRSANISTNTRPQSPTLPSPAPTSIHPTSVDANPLPQGSLFPSRVSSPTNFEGVNSLREISRSLSPSRETEGKQRKLISPPPSSIPANPTLHRKLSRSLSLTRFKVKRTGKCHIPKRKTVDAYIAHFPLPHLSVTPPSSPVDTSITPPFSPRSSSLTSPIPTTNYAHLFPLHPLLPPTPSNPPLVSSDSKRRPILSITPPVFTSPSTTPTTSPVDPWAVLTQSQHDQIVQTTLGNYQQRVVRVFLSSTFVDMHEEREEIMRHVMVELEAFCYKRGVALTYIDMRWGITTEMTKQTILRCLQEVDHSRPYFVGIIAQRYGWHQETDGADPLLTETFKLAELEPSYSWIKNFRTSSVTELEIQHGFLLHPYLPDGHSFFFFRDPAYLELLDDAKKKSFQDSSPYAIKKLSELKQAIRKKERKGKCQVFEYMDPKELGSQLLASLKASIERDFPVSHMSEIESMCEGHTNFAHQKCLTYVPNNLCLQVLDEFANAATGCENEDGQCLIVTGASGSGKSSLIAHWWHVAKASLGIPIFVHFIGSCSFASDFSSMILRLFKEINAIIVSNGGIALELPIDEHDIVEHIPIFFCALAQYEQMIIIFDAVNQLAPKYQSLWWLPTSLPPEVNIICTTIEFDPSASLSGRQFRMAELGPMQDDDKRKLIFKRLQLYGKILLEKHIDQLCSHPCSHNPLFLQTTLTELCTIGYFQLFQEQLDTLMKCVDLDELFQCVIHRLEESFSLTLTRDVLLLISCSRFGILESVLQTITKAKPVCLFPLLSALKILTIIHHGKLKFGHLYIQKAVLKRYSDEQLHQTRHNLAQYLTQCEFDEQIAFELPWLLMQIIQSSHCQEKTKSRQQLADLLLDLDHCSIFGANPILKGELVKYWSTLITLSPEESKPNVGELYHRQVTKLTCGTLSMPDFSSMLPTLRGVQNFLHDSGHQHWSQLIAEQTLKLSITHFGENHNETANSLSDVGVTMESQGNLKEALEYKKKALDIRLSLFGESHPDTADSLNNVGITLYSQDNLEDALEYYQRAFDIRVSLFGENHPQTAGSLNNLSPTLTSLGKLEEALGCCQRALSIDLSVYGENHPNTADSLNNTGIALVSQGKLEEALEQHERALAIHLNLFGENHPDTAISLNNVGVALYSQGELEEAVKIHHRALAIRLELFGETHPDTAASLNNIGIALASQGHLEEALEYHNRALSIRLCVFGENHSDTAASINNIGNTLAAQGNLEEALESYEKALAIKMTLFGENRPDIATALNNIGVTLDSLGNLEEALGYLEQALSIRLSLFGENHPNTADSLHNIGVVLTSQGKLEEALVYLKEALSIRLSLFGENHQNTADSLHNIGVALASQGNEEEALEYYQSAYSVRLQLFGEDHPDTVTSLQDIAMAFNPQIPFEEQAESEGALFSPRSRS